MKRGLTKDEILARYPENKPVCLNYATIREDILALIEDNESKDTQMKVLESLIEIL